ncbi:hypothetical protein QYE76_047257 [Lolium multiflorum]|uniref:SWIM-type domain-containing protein n=1 Tax=Lolium multiflorum TaxID=4521 RepID=A0AAD8TNH5_LOLMU|nr:hypothetical protein QYE76_047257 [Lolium multiflorum]
MCCSWGATTSSPLAWACGTDEGHMLLVVTWVASYSQAWSQTTGCGRWQQRLAVDTPRSKIGDKTLLDTACSGSFTRNKEEFKWDLLDRIQENTEGWENDKGRESAELPNDDFRVEQLASIALAPTNPLQQYLEDHESEVFREERNELDEIFLRQPILKHDLPVEDLGTTPPPKEDPVFDLKPLPDNLKYAYIDDKKTYPVIISAKLSDFEEKRLLEILKKHRGAIGYTLDDLKGISPSICQHAINIWVSPVHCVPKKGGITVVPNDNDELIPQRIVGWYKPSPPRTSGRWGDAGQGSSQAAPPQFDDDGSDDDGDDGGDYKMDGSMASRIDNEKASTDVDDSRWEGYDISSSEDEYEVPSSDDDDSIFGDPVSESDNMDIDDEDSISDTHDEPTSENTSDVVVIRNSELTYYGDSDLEDFAYKEDVPEQSKSLEGGFHSCQNLNAKAKKIKDHQKSRIMSLGAAGMRLFNIMRSFISDSGKYSTVGFVRKDLYNMSCREKMKMIAKGDANTTIGIMEKRKRDDPEFFFDYKLGKGGKLLHLFWCDSQSRQDYADFGDVLVFDSTYKTNRYAMPFIPFVGINNHRQTTVFACAIVSDEKEKTYKWLLETFLKAMYQQKPKGIITDGDAAMIAAVGKVFPGVWYRVCTWHIEKNMKKHLDPLAHNEFRSLLYYSTSEQVFEERWRAFVEKHQTALTKEWMKRMYARKKLWSAAYLANGYFLGMKSNQRSESLNSTLHTHLDFGLTIVDMVVHYENNSSRVREEEARHDAIDSQTLPVAVTRYKDIETSAAHKFTAANFYLVQEELKKIGGLEIVDQLGCVGGVSTFVVSWMNNRKYLFSVDYRPESKEETITCSCRRMYRKGLPCKHILFVLHYVGCSEIPNCCVLRRFSKNARYGLPSRRESDLYGWGWEGVAERRKHSELTMIGAEAFDAALHDPESFSELMQCMKGIIYRRKGAQTSHSTAYHEDAQNRGDAPVVGDPDMAETKGAPKQNKRYYKDKDTNQQTSKHGRILAHDERKKERLCTACNQPGHNRNNKMKCRLHKE